MIKISQVALTFLGLTILTPSTFSSFARTNETKDLSTNLASFSTWTNSISPDKRSKQIAHIRDNNIEKNIRDRIISSVVKININGKWKSSEGTITFSESDDPTQSGKISGTYTQDNGVIIGWIDDEYTFNGYWIEDKANQRCSTPRNGRYYWGRVRLNFYNSSFPAFNGLWGYCNSEPTNRWTGSKLTK